MMIEILEEKMTVLVTVMIRSVILQISYPLRSLPIHKVPRYIYLTVVL